MRINNNIMAMNTHRQYAINNSNVAKSTEKLSSGYRINRAGDDAAGLAISEKMRAQIRGLNMASKNSQDAISLLQTAEGALTETHSILQRMRELAVQSSSDTNESTVDRVALDAEFQQLKSEINDIASKTKFNEMALLDGSFGVSVDTNNAVSDIFDVAGVISVSASGNYEDYFEITDDGTDLTIEHFDSAGTSLKSVTISGGTMAGGAQTLNVSEFGLTIQTHSGFVAASLTGTTITMQADPGGTASGGIIQTGANKDDSLNIKIGAMDATSIGIGTAGVTTRSDAADAITYVNTAINTVSTQRANLGALQNRLEHKINNLDTSAENLQAAESRIRDLDMAAEMTTFTQNNILVQAATAMLAQANAAPQGVLKLLQ